MTNISFTSTYRIPITQAGANPAKKEKLRELVEPYPNKLVSKSNTGTVRVSIPNEEDAKFIKNLKSIGYRVYQKFEGENIKTEKLADYIKTKLRLGEYQQVGTQKKRLSTSAKSKRYAAQAQKENLDAAHDNESKIQKKLTKSRAYLNQAISEQEELGLRLSAATEKAEKAQAAKLLAEIIEETKKARSVVETPAKRRKILKDAAKRTEEARQLAQEAELDKAECTMLYKEAVEKVEDAKLNLEAKEEVLRERMACKKQKSDREKPFNPYDTDFNFEDYEI
ncbi:MAG: hypothetical protein NC191_04655 [Muribaculaceae bacterium]|nr:hypothetical protein [Muribaculaceae bacterium]